MPRVFCRSCPCVLRESLFAGNIRQCTELVCADGRHHGDERPFRTRACQFFGRIPAHEAETVREQQHTYNHSTRSGPQRGVYDFPIDSHGRSSRLREELKKYCTRTPRAESEQNSSLSRPHSPNGFQPPQPPGPATLPPVPPRPAT